MRAAVALVALVACSSKGPGSPASTGGVELQQLMQARKLTDQDVAAALKTYTPSGRHDEYLLFGSGGHSGQVVVVGVPSMRILKYIAVFTPEPWQGYGFDDQTKAILAQGNRLRLVVNGTQVLDWRDPEPDRIKEGPLGLQLHSHNEPQEVHFKNLVLTTFPEDKLITVKK